MAEYLKHSGSLSPLDPKSWGSQIVGMKEHLQASLLVEGKHCFVLRESDWWALRCWRSLDSSLYV